MRSYDTVAAIAARQHGLIARSQAIDAGIPSSTFTDLARGFLLPRHPGVFALKGVPPSREQHLLAACLAAGDGAAVSHRAGGCTWDLLDGEASRVEIVTPRARWPRLENVVVHRSTDLAPEHVTWRAGVPTTNPMRTLIDLGAVCSIRVVADALERALAARLITVRGAEAIVFDISRPGRRGGGVLRRVLDDRALRAAAPDGLLEPRMARLLRRFDLPDAAFQYVIRDGAGRFVARVDFAYPALRIAIEVDGFAVHGSVGAMTADFVRQNKLPALGWHVLRFTWHQVVRQPKAVADAIRAVLVTVGAA